MIFNNRRSPALEDGTTSNNTQSMKEKQLLIDTLNEILKSPTSALSFDDSQKLNEVIAALKKAQTKEEIINALKPLAYLLGLIKTLAEIFSG